MNQCYDRKSTLYEGQIQFVDPITRQTHPADNLQNCTDPPIKNLSIRHGPRNSWYTLTPGIVHQEVPAVSAPKDASPVASHSFPGSQDAGR